jgi:hypothetical protein
MRLNFWLRLSLLCKLTMFGGLFKIDDEPLEAQQADIDAMISQMPNGTYFAMTSVDALPGCHGPFGYSISNPIPVNGPVGESVYIFRLRSKGGKPFYYQRLGSTKSVEFNRPIDVLELVSSDGREWVILYFSMYHIRRSTLAPEGLALVSWKKHKEPFGMMAKLGAFGSTTQRSESFPACLPSIIAANDDLQQIAPNMPNICAESTRSVLSKTKVSPRPYSYEKLCEQLHLQHTDSFFHTPTADEIGPATVAEDVPTKSFAMNRFGDSAAAVEHYPDGKKRLIGGKSADFISGLLSIFQIAWDKVSDRDKVIFSRHMQLSGNMMSVEHREVFSYAMLHHLLESKHTLKNIPEGLRGVVSSLPDIVLLLPDLPRPLSDEIRMILLKTLSNAPSS